MKGFCYLGYRLNACGGSEAAVTTKTKTQWTKFGTCGELLYGGKFLLKKGFTRVVKRSKMWYGSDTWCQRENEMEILRRNKQAMIRTM